MRKIVLAAALVIATTGVALACTTHTYFINGRIVTCTTCGNVTNCW